VALGRAIIREPRVFLFDEPLSNLDARLRTEMRATIKKLYRRLKVTSIYVTHDQVEAMTIGEQLVVMKDGRIHQVGSPEECYHHPANRFVASFLGSPAMNFLQGRYDRGDSTLVLDGDVRVALPASVASRLVNYTEPSIVVGIRPEDALPQAPGPAECLRLDGRVILEEPLGHETLRHVEVAGIEMVTRGSTGFRESDDGRASLYIEGERVYLFSKEQGTAL
jgi:multiple sugar transport system ATP-binding protein